MNQLRSIQAVRLGRRHQIEAEEAAWALATPTILVTADIDNTKAGRTRGPGPRSKPLVTIDIDNMKAGRETGTERMRRW